MWLKVILFLLTIFFRSSFCGISNCKHKEFRCDDGTCLFSEKLCNGVEDCRNGEDETGNEQWDCSRLTLGTSSECGDHRKFYRCRLGGCVPRDQVCDGIIHCFGGSDEASDLCKAGRLKPIPGLGQQNKAGNTNRVKPANQHQSAHLPNNFPVARPTTTQPTTTPRPKVVQQRPPQRPRPPVFARPPTIIPDQCPVNALEAEEGEEILCRSGGTVVKCLELGGMVPNGTVVVYRCKKHYTPPNNGPTTTKRFCRSDAWTRRNPKWFCDLQCGNGGRDIISLIVNGSQSTQGKWPWHVGFYQQNPPGSSNYEYYCGGTLLSSRQVLTAGHCVTKKDSTDKRNDDIVLGFGKFYRSFGNNDQHVKFRKIAQIDVNQYYEAERFGSDIALVWLNETLEFTDRILPACLPSSNQADVDAGDLGTLAGWGRYSDKGYPEEMQEARLPVVSSRTCQQAHPSLEALVKLQTFCAGYRNSTSACEGDSGGGLVFEYNGRWSVHGVVSAGVAKKTGGCDPKYYTVFTRVSMFRDWIDGILDAKTG